MSRISVFSGDMSRHESIWEPGVTFEVHSVTGLKPSDQGRNDYEEDGLGLFDSIHCYRAFRMF